LKRFRPKVKWLFTIKSWKDNLTAIVTKTNLANSTFSHELKFLERADIMN